MFTRPQKRLQDHKNVYKTTKNVYKTTKASKDHKVKQDHIVKQDHKNVYKTTKSSKTTKTFTRPQKRFQDHRNVYKTIETFTRPFFNFVKVKEKNN